jgi:hypothetical protein
MMSHENLIEELRRREAELERHRKRVTRAQKSLAIVSDAYSVVIAHLRSASGDSEPATRGETITAA